MIDIDKDINLDEEMKIDIGEEFIQDMATNTQNITTDTAIDTIRRSLSEFTDKHLGEEYIVKQEYNKNEDMHSTSDIDNTILQKINKSDNEITVNADRNENTKSMIWTKNTLQKPNHVRAPALKSARVKSSHQLEIPILADRCCPQCKGRVGSCGCDDHIACQKCKIKLFLQCLKCHARCVKYDNMVHHLKNKCKYKAKGKCFRITESYDGPYLEHCNKIEGFHCAHCPFVTKYKDSLKSHLLKHFTRKDNFRYRPKTKGIITLCQRYCVDCDVSVANKPTNNNLYCTKCKAEYQLECLKCNYRCERYRDMSGHLLNKCKVVTLFRCSECNYRTLNKICLERHVTRHLIARQIAGQKAAVVKNTCPKCGKSFKRSKYTRNHMRFCGVEPNLSCDNCSFKTKHKETLKHHLEMHLTGERSNRPVNIRRRDFRMSNKRPGSKFVTKFQCTECDYASPFSFFLAKHVKRMHSTKKCPKCDKFYKSHESLVKHIKLCGIEPNLSCDCCPFKTKYKTALERHLKKIHMTDAGSRREPLDEKEDLKIKKRPQATFLHLYDRYCAICDKLEPNRAFENSSNCHQCQSAYLMQCRKCNVRLKTRQSINNHVTSRCPPRLFQCTECDYKTAREPFLQSHIKRKHTAVVPEKCLKCGKFFSSLNRLTKHAKVCHKQVHMMSDAERQASIEKEKDPSVKKTAKANFLNWYQRYCPSCDDSVPNSASKNSSICQKCKRKNLLQCVKCAQTCTSHSAMYYHLVGDRGINAPRFKCTECNYRTTQRRILQNHIRQNHTVVESEKSEKCLRCGESFLSVASLAEHAKLCGVELNLSFDAVETCTDKKTKFVFNEVSLK